MHSQIHAHEYTHTHVQLDDYVHQLEASKVPRLESEGERLRLGQLICQLPKQDFSLSYCRQLHSAEQKEVFRDLMKSRLECLDVASVVNLNTPLQVCSCVCLCSSVCFCVFLCVFFLRVLSLVLLFVLLRATHLPSNLLMQAPTSNRLQKCHQCKENLQSPDLCVVADKLQGAVWHPGCFVCSGCEELLVDLCYCAKDGAVWCERHFAELFRPRCGACDELIFSGEYTKAMDHDWHNGHFACFHCDLNLTGHRSVVCDSFGVFWWGLWDVCVCVVWCGVVFVVCVVWYFFCVCGWV